jgi:glycerol-3-phosphate dehydrogenase (NAD(P)+)
VTPRWRADIQQRRFNPVYLPEIRFRPMLRVTADLGDALNGSELVIAAVPSHGTREVLRKAAPHIRRGATVVSATKGLEGNTLFGCPRSWSRSAHREHASPCCRGRALRSSWLASCRPQSRLPRAIQKVVERVQAEFRAPYFRLYGTDDVVGVEIGGALKNIIAIAAGVVEGLGLGHNALAALTTRGLAEMSRLACAAGAKRETLSGLTGLGDLVLTCTGHLSRNRHVGMELASGRALQDVLGGMKMVAEGVRTTEAALRARGAVWCGVADRGTSRGVVERTQGRAHGALGIDDSPAKG